MQMKKNKNNKVVDYLDGDGALPATEKEMKKWIQKYLSAEDKAPKGKGSYPSQCPRG